MNKIIWKIILILLLSISFTNTYAEEIVWNKIIISAYVEQKITVWYVFDFFASYYKWQVPESYKYIKVNYKDVVKWSKLEDSLQVLMYLNLIKNPSLSLNKDKELNINDAPNYASNAAAITGGLSVGDVYKNGDNLCIVH